MPFGVRRLLFDLSRITDASSSYCTSCWDKHMRNTAVKHEWCCQAFDNAINLRTMPGFAMVSIHERDSGARQFYIAYTPYELSKLVDDEGLIVRSLEECPMCGGGGVAPVLFRRIRFCPSCGTDMARLSSGCAGQLGMIERAVPSCLRPGRYRDVTSSSANIECVPAGKQHGWFRFLRSRNAYHGVWCCESFEASLHNYNSIGYCTVPTYHLGRPRFELVAQFYEPSLLKAIALGRGRFECSDACPLNQGVGKSLVAFKPILHCPDCGAELAPLIAKNLEKFKEYLADVPEHLRAFPQRPQYESGVLT